MLRRKLLNARRKAVATNHENAIVRACQTALENLEDRRLLSSTIFQSDASNSYVAIEAENAYTTPKQQGNGALASWNVVTGAAANGNSTTASGGAALLVNKSGNNTNSTGASATYHIHFNAPGTYRLYVRDKFAGTGDNSMTVPPSGGAINAAPTTAAVFDDDASVPLLDGRVLGDYNWALTPTPTTFTVAAAGDTAFTLGQRENGYYVDRFVLSSNTSMTAAQLDALASTPITLGTPVVTGAATGLSVKLNWQAVPGAAAYDIKRGSAAGGPTRILPQGSMRLRIPIRSPMPATFSTSSPPPRRVRQVARRQTLRSRQREPGHCLLRPLTLSAAVPILSSTGLSPW